MPQPTRSPAEIRSSIEANRVELALALERLRGEVAELTDWRLQLQRHRGQLIAGAAVVGFVVGVRMLRRRGRR
jgi:hypothetical protein